MHQCNFFSIKLGESVQNRRYYASEIPDISNKQGHNRISRNQALASSHTDEGYKGVSGKIYYLDIILSIVSCFVLQTRNKLYIKKNVYYCQWDKSEQETKWYKNKQLEVIVRSSTMLIPHRCVKKRTNNQLFKFVANLLGSLYTLIDKGTSSNESKTSYIRKNFKKEIY